MRFRISIDLEENTKPNIEGSIQSENNGNHYKFIDGWTLGELDKNHNHKGYYNLINWYSTKGKLIAENDILGYRPLYIYLSSKGIVISDNFWELVHLIEDIKINYKALNQLIHFRRLVPSYKTCIKNVYRLPAGSKLTYQKGESEPNIVYLKNFKQDPDPSIDVESAADQLHNAFLETFSSIKNRVEKKEILFGNSGGLDSRLIPAYAQEIGIDLNGYLVCNKKPKGLVNQSIISARKVSEYFNFKFDTINYDEGDGWERLLRDLYVNPFGPSNFIKNPHFKNFENKYILNGGNSFIIANDNNFWRNEKAKNSPVKSFVEKYFFRNGGDENLIPRYQKLLAGQVKEILGPNSSSFSVMRTLHQSFLNLTSSAGGFESMSLAGEAETIHHPFITDIAKKWPEHIFFDRQVQTTLFEKYFPQLLSIPDQRGSIRRKSGFFPKLRNFYYSKMNRLRTNGLDYNSWIGSDWYQQAQKKSSKFVSDSESKKSIDLLNDTQKYSSAKDKMDISKLAVLLAHLEQGIKPKP